MVSYNNDVKANVLSVDRRDIDRHGAVSRSVAEAMANGAAKLMRTDCAIATTGIAGPGGGTKYKPVGTVWIAVKYLDTVVSECQHFQGDRDTVIENATNRAVVTYSYNFCATGTKPKKISTTNKGKCPSDIWLSRK